jgi:tetratricopeptide (TPR) repeat protein
MDHRKRLTEAGKDETPSQADAAGGIAAVCATVIEDMRAGRILDAQIRSRQALEAAPDHPELLHLMALVCFNAREFDHAVEWASRAARTTPKPAYLSTLGIALLNLERHDEALKVFDAAVQLAPDDAGLWSNLGEALIVAGRTSEALPCLQRALEIDPSHAGAAFKCGVILHQQRRLEEALAAFNLCDRLRPQQAPTLHMRALVLHNLQRFEEAFADDRRAHALDPGNAYICNNLGYNLIKLGRPDQALPWIERALAIDPEFVEALNNKAFALTELHRFEEARAIYHRSRAIDPDHAETEWSLALLDMLLGDFEAGWPGREARFRLPDLPVSYPKFGKPQWFGEEPLDGKTILLFADEGLGDSIQFARYVPMVAARGARVVLAVEEAVRPLLSGISGVAQCQAKSDPLPAFDLYCPLSSLPLAFRTRLDSVPADMSYLPPPPDERVRAWADRLGPHDRLRVGLVWSGNPRHVNDRKRSIPLLTLTGLLDTEATFVSLQKEPRPEDRTVLAASGIEDPTAGLTNFVETAALIRNLDLVISVDTSVAHLAGALACPTWILLPYTADYRWLTDRDDSPWYPSVRLFRQNAAREYHSVIDRMREELVALTAKFDVDYRCAAING